MTQHLMASLTIPYDMESSSMRLKALHILCTNIYPLQWARGPLWPHLNDDGLLHCPLWPGVFPKKLKAATHSSSSAHTSTSNRLDPFWFPPLQSTYCLQLILFIATIMDYLFNLIINLFMWSIYTIKHFCQVTFAFFTMWNDTPLDVQLCNTKQTKLN
jgi:hypothetical protein